MLRLIALVAALLAVAVGVVPAGAKVAGTNGQIVFSRSLGSSGDFATFVANADGSNVHRLFRGASAAPHWSPDGRLVALTACLNPPTCDSASVIVNPDTGAFHSLTRPDPTLDLTACFIWSPDGQRLACDGQSQSDPRRNGLYTILSSNGQGLTRITSVPGGEDFPFDYSPDGKQIVFSRTLDPNAADADGALFVVNTDGSGLHQITPFGLPDRDDGGSWSPDGRTILFSGKGEAGSLFTVHPDGSDLQQIPLATADHSALAHDPGWSPDGTAIVFNLFTPSSGRQGLYTAEADGSHLHRLTTSPTQDGFPDWGSHPAVACTAAEKEQRVKALRAYTRGMAGARRAYFHVHRNAKARAAFVKHQQATLHALQQRLAACG